MRRFLPIVLEVCACLTLAGCTSADSSTGEWIEQLRMFVEEFARNALAAFLV